MRGGNGVHGPGTLLLCRVAEGGTSGHRACPEQPRGRERWQQTAGQAPPEPGLWAPWAGTPTPSWGRQRHPQEGCLRPPRAAPPRPQGTVQAECARSSSVCKYFSWVLEVLSRGRRETGDVPSLGRPVFRKVTAPDGLWAVCRGRARDVFPRPSPAERPPRQAAVGRQPGTAPRPLPPGRPRPRAHRTPIRSPPSGSLPAISPCRIR